MRIVFGVLLITVLALGQSASRGQSLLEKEIANDRKRQRDNEIRSVGTNVIRLVDGRAYNVLNSTNWITLPGLYERGKFLRATPDGMAFEIEVRLAEPGIEYRFDRIVVVTNCPLQLKVKGEPMPLMRVKPVGTSTFLRSPAPIYDWGVLPK